jgi:hypothetical protein
MGKKPLIYQDGPAPKAPQMPGVDIAGDHIRPLIKIEPHDRAIETHF